MNTNSHVINTFSYIWRQPVDQCVQHLADQGFREFEILLTAPHLWPASFGTCARRKLIGTLDQTNSTVISLNAGGFDNNLVSPAKDVRARTRDYLRRVIDLANDLGAKFVVMSPGAARPLLPPPREWLLEWFREGVALLARHADATDVKLLIENIPFAFLPRAENLITAIADLPLNRVGVIYDVANAVYAREDPIEGLKHVASRLDLVHLSDTPLDTWRHDAVGRGVVPFERFGVALRGYNYRGPVVLEIISDDPDHAIRESIQALSRLGWR